MKRCDKCGSVMEYIEVTGTYLCIECLWNAFQKRLLMFQKAQDVPKGTNNHNDGNEKSST